MGKTKSKATKAKSSAKSSPAHHSAKKAKKPGNRKFPKPGYWSNGALATELSSVGLRIVEVKPDGNCLFRALSDQLYGDEANHLELRLRIVRFITDNADTFSPFIEDDESFEDYVTRMGQDSTWGGQIELQAAIRLLQITICLHQAESPVWTMTDPEQGPGTRPTVHLSFHDNDHYNSIRSGNDHGTGAAAPINASWQDGAAAISTLATQQTTADSSKEKEDYVLLCTGCDDRLTASVALQATGGNVDQAIEMLVDQHISDQQTRAGSVAALPVVAAVAAAGASLCLSGDATAASSTEGVAGSAPQAAPLQPLSHYDLNEARNTAVGEIRYQFPDGMRMLDAKSTGLEQTAAGSSRAAMIEERRMAPDIGSVNLPLSAATVPLPCNVSATAVSPTETKATANSIKSAGHRKTRHLPPRNRNCVCGSNRKFKVCCGSVQGRANANAAALAPERQLAQLLL